MVGSFLGSPRRSLPFHPSFRQLPIALACTEPFHSPHFCLPVSTCSPPGRTAVPGLGPIFSVHTQSHTHSVRGHLVAPSAGTSVMSVVAAGRRAQACAGEEGSRKCSLEQQASLWSSKRGPLEAVCSLECTPPGREASGHGNEDAPREA